MHFVSDDFHLGHVLLKPVFVCRVEVGNQRSFPLVHSDPALCITSGSGEMEGGAESLAD